MAKDLPADLLEIAKKHTVRFETWFHQEFHDDKLVVVGFDLELYGTHYDGHSSNTPGCATCIATYEDLRRIAEAVLPPPDRPTDYEVRPFDHGLHTEGSGPAEVMVAINIRHRSGYFSGVDECEEGCLKEIEERLRALGIKGRRRR